MQVGHVYSRRALLIAPVHSYRENAAASQVMAGKDDVVSGAGASSGESSSSSSFDANVVMVLAVLLFALGLNFMVRCAVRCSSRMAPPAGATEQQRQQPEEEALALARMAQAGARRKALRAMPTLVYSAELPLQQQAPVCAVCLGDLAPGDRVRVLPKCNHGFHARCVDRWLVARSTCPTCRRPLFGAPQKGSGCVHGGDAEPPVQALLAPLRSERFITPYDF